MSPVDDEAATDDAPSPSPGRVVVRFVVAIVVAVAVSEIIGGFLPITDAKVLANAKQAILVNVVLTVYQAGHIRDPKDVAKEFASAILVAGLAFLGFTAISYFLR